MSKRIVVDPITRIEGHLRVEVVVDDNNTVTDSYVSATLFRGLELILKGRDPRDAGLFAQRICGVCTSSHYKAGVMAVEDALKIDPPLNAKLVRSLISSSLMLHDHIVHFYQLTGLDWIDIVSALKADPKKAAKLAYKYSDNPIATGEAHLKDVQAKVKGLVDKGQLGPFANAYWGNPTYHLSPEENLIGVSHYLEALQIQRDAAQCMAIFGGKNPHPQSLVVGGVTCVMDLLDPARMGEFLFKYEKVADFVDRAYYADVVMVGRAYAKEPSVLNDVGVGNLFTYKELQTSDNEWLFESGIILNGDLSKVYEVDETRIVEDLTHSWYGEDEKPLHPYDGKTVPKYTGFKDGDSINSKGKVEKTKVLDGDGKYSWIKAPRYGDVPMQVGPLANIVINYAKGNKKVVPIVDKFLKDTGLPLAAALSTLGRNAARMMEAKTIADHGLEAFHNLVANLKVDQSTYTSYSIDKDKEYKGRYIGHVPRGVLSHWVRIKNGKIENYQAVVPSTWNASPHDKNGVQGSYGECLIGLKIADLTQPLEIVRKIHSYDPCIACAVHVMDTKGNELSQYKMNTSSCGI